MVIFALDQVPEMARGRGVRLQTLQGRRAVGHHQRSTAKTGSPGSDGAGREFTATLKELADWRGNRGDAGRLAPRGFPKSNKFGRVVE